MALTSAWFATDMQLQNAAENHPPLRRGSSGGGVGRLQQALVQLGYPMPKSVKSDGTADGIFGGETDSAVRAYQTKKSLSPDGIAGHDTLTLMDAELVGTLPGGGMTATERQTVTADLENARIIARRCTMLLLRAMFFPANPKAAPPRPAALQESIPGLLMDTFDIDGSDPGQVELVKRRFMGFEGRSRVMEFEKTGRHAPKDQSLGHEAFVEYTFGSPLANNTVYLTPAYFAKTEATERALTLLHEYVHLYNAGPGHPGRDGHPDSGQMLHFMRTRIGIPFEHALYNPYCYEYFAKWSA